jgi:leader peptidase (prepilin peptidase) / N-methyltransferase
MLLLNLFIFFILGTIIGSFLNVVVLRYNTGLSIISGSSRCFSCSKDLHWYELIPLFSFLMLRGKCLGCNSKISYQYPIVEFITAVTFSLLFLKFGLTPLLPLYIFIASILVTMSVYDFIHKIIPDGMVILFIILSFIVLCFSNGLGEIFNYPFSHDLLAGPILFSFFAFFWLISEGRWMGFGDAKLAIGVGFLLGLSGGIFAVMLSFWIGAIVSLILILLEKFKMAKCKLTFKSEVPFAPFIITAVFIQILTSWNLQSIINLLS